VIYCQWLHRSKIVYRQCILTNAIVQLPVPLVSPFLIDLSVVSNVYLICVLLYLVYKHKNRTTATSWAGTTDHSRAPEFFPVFSGVCVTQSLAFSVELLVVSWSFFFWPLQCLSFNLLPLITHWYLQIFLSQTI